MNKGKYIKTINPSLTRRIGGRHDMTNDCVYVCTCKIFIQTQHEVSISTATHRGGRLTLSW